MSTVPHHHQKWKMPTKLRFYYFWFEDHIVRWINKSKICGEQWITASIEMEQARQVTCRVLHSASVVDTFSTSNGWAPAPFNLSVKRPRDES